MRKIILVILIIILICLPGCNNAGISDSILSEIKAGMTGGEIYELIGPSSGDHRSILYPIYRVWELNDGRILEIGFKIDGCNTQSEFSELIKREGVFYSGDKESALENENPTGPTYVDMTEDSIKYAKEWMKANFKTISASIIDGNEITVLFGK